VLVAKNTTDANANFFKNVFMVSTFLSVYTL